MTAKLTQSDSKLVTASANDLHLAPRKMRPTANLIKGMNAMDAMVQLQHVEKKASEMLIKLLKSAIANAKNNFSMDTEHLYIKSISTDMGKVMKRYFPRARGSAFTIRRKMCHVNIVLEERKKGKASKSKLSLFKAKTEKPEVENVDQKTATNERPPKDETKKSQVFRTDEQKKMSTAANKRRLFNRKTGE